MKKLKNAEKQMPTFLGNSLKTLDWKILKNRWNRLSY